MRMVFTADTIGDTYQEGFMALLGQYVQPHGVLADLPQVPMVVATQ